MRRRGIYEKMRRRGDNRGDGLIKEEKGRERKVREEDIEPNLIYFLTKIQIHRRTKHTILQKKKLVL